MLKRLISLSFVLHSLLTPETITAADKTEALEYDIFERDDSIAVWLNFAQFLTSKRVENLKEGIDLAIEFQLTLKRPRRLWGSERIMTTTGSMKIEYRIVTEDYVVSAPKLGLAGDRCFLSLAKLHHFLNDSVEVNLADCSALFPDKRYVLELKVTCILLTTLNLASNADTTTETSSPLKYLFRKFLSITGFGRDEYFAKSRPFSVTELGSSR
ncbi:MAG: DUF4390 domain-containing protein [Candidatus Zixiibacteriota bacterium]